MSENDVENIEVVEAAEAVVAQAPEAADETPAAETPAADTSAEAASTVDAPEEAASDEDAEPGITFGSLGLPEGIVRKLAQNGVTAPFPIQAATIPDALAARTSSAVAVPAPARPSPSVCRCWPRSPAAPPRRRSRAASSSPPPVSSRCRSRTPSSRTATCSA